MTEFARAIIIYLACVLGVVLVLYGFASRAGTQGSCESAIVFLVDASGSMTQPELDIARRSHAEAMTSFEVLSAVADSASGRVAVAYLEYGDAPILKIDWMLVDGPEAAGIFASRVMDGGAAAESSTSTALGRALIMADEVLARAPCVTTRLVVDVFGDGASNSGPNEYLGRNMILSRGAVINAIPLMRDPAGNDVDRHFAEFVVGGPGSFSMPVKDIGAMPMALRSKIVQELF